MQWRRWSLHQLRHSALTREAEDGTNTPTLLQRSRHASVRSLERYARSGVDAVARHVAQRDPLGRRRTAGRTQQTNIHTLVSLGLQVFDQR